MKRAHLRVDFEAIGHNVRQWRRFLSERELWAVVKSNAYGLGAAPVARACVAAGAQKLCVVAIDEARELREADVTAPIVCVATTPPADYEQALAHDIAVTVDDARAAQTLDALAAKRKKQARAHVSIDTGTGWSGLQPPNVKPFAKIAAELSHVRWEGVWTHIAGLDSMGAQTAEFRRAVTTLREAGLAFAYEHLASTAPAIAGAGGNAARVGIGLYGSTYAQPTLVLQLKSAIDLRAPVISVKRFEADTPLGYGGAYVAREGDLIATLRVGYADGLPRSLSNRGNVLIDGERCPIVGAIGMNFTMVKLLPESRVGPADEAHVIGDEDGLHIDEVALASGIIPHELVTSVARML